MIDSKLVELMRSNKEMNCDKLELDQEIVTKFNNWPKVDSYCSSFLEKIGNGGFFFNYSLQLYSFNKKFDFLNIDLVNRELNNAFGNLFTGCVSFGQDIFGNQFVIDLSSLKVYFFNSESGDREYMCDSFDDWLKVLAVNLDFYTGMPYAERWYANNSLKASQRLCPKKPFVIGGEYEVENFFPSEFPNYIRLYGDIANQIYNLKDGEKVKIVFKNM